MKETYKVKTPNKILFGDPLYFERESEENLKRLVVNCTPNDEYATRVVLTEQPYDDCTDEIMREMSIYMTEETHLSVYMKNMYYACQNETVKDIGVDSASYILEVDDKSNCIETGGDGYWGNYTEYDRQIDEKNIVEAVVIRILMPFDYTFEDMRQQLNFLFADIEQIDNIEEAKAEQISIKKICSDGVTVKDFDGKDILIMSHFNRYAVKDYLGREMTIPAISLSVKTENGYEPFATITKCFGEFIGIKNVAYIDLNNCPFATKLLDLGIAKDTGIYKESGFFRYLLWQFNEDFLKNIGGEEYMRYSDEYDQYMRGEMYDDGVQEMM